MINHCLIQKRIRLAACTVLLAIAPFYAVGAAKPMSDSDMGDVSAESGDILNVMGASAAGDKPAEPSSAAQDNVAYIEADKPIESTTDHTLTPSHSNAKNIVSTFKMSERSDGKLGSSTIFYDEKDNVIDISHSENTLSINQNVHVQEVQIHQVRSAPTAPVRGDYSAQGIYVNAAVSITPR